MWLAALLILGLLAWGGYYVCNHGFSRHWRVRVSEEFRRRGLDLYVHRLTLDPIQGLVAREVQIFDATDPNRVLATIDRVALDINLTNLLAWPAVPGRGGFAERRSVAADERG